MYTIIGFILGATCYSIGFYFGRKLGRKEATAIADMLIDQAIKAIKDRRA